ncbi:hypothetical protein ABZ642_43555 [Streptomyces sp. NPDC007157]
MTGAYEVVVAGCGTAGLSAALVIQGPETGSPAYGSRTAARTRGGP